MTLALCGIASGAGSNAIAQQTTQTPPAQPAAGMPAPPGASGPETLPASFRLDGSLSSAQPPTDVPQELEEIVSPQQGSLDIPAAERPLDYLAERAKELEDATGLRVGFAYTALFQQASAGPGHRSAAAGDVDLLAKWTLLGRGTKNTGQLVFAAEYRHQIGSTPPSALGSEIGTLIGTTNGFSERPMVVKEFYWIQRLFEDKLRIGAGRADPENLVGGHKLQSANTAFFNKAFSSNPTIAYPGSGATAGLSFRPSDLFYVTVGAVNAYGRTTTMEVDELFNEWDLFTFAECGVTPTIDGAGPGRYRVALWHIDERKKDKKPDDQGFSVILEQDFGESLQTFARYGHSDAELTGVRNLYEAGVGVKGLLGSKDNLAGLAFAVADPRAGGKRSEKIVEVFQRWQVTAQSQFTLGVETIIDPSNAPNDDVLGVFSARMRLTF